VFLLIKTFQVRVKGGGHPLHLFVLTLAAPWWLTRFPLRFRVNYPNLCNNETRQLHISMTTQFLSHHDFPRPPPTLSSLTDSERLLHGQHSQLSKVLASMIAQCSKSLSLGAATVFLCLRMDKLQVHIVSHIRGGRSAIPEPT
jgi:hypothetical protein